MYVVSITLIIFIYSNFQFGVLIPKYILFLDVLFLKIDILTLNSLRENFGNFFQFVCNVFVTSKSSQARELLGDYLFFSTYRISLDLEGTLVIEFRHEVSSQKLIK